MFGELRDRLPEELVWNIIKYMQHPCVEILEEGIKAGAYIKCGFCRNVIFLDNGNWSCEYTEDIICGACFVIHKEELIHTTEEQDEDERYEEYLNEQIDSRVFYNGDSDSDSD